MSLRDHNSSMEVPLEQEPAGGTSNPWPVASSAPPIMQPGYFSTIGKLPSVHNLSLNLTLIDAAKTRLDTGGGVNTWPGGVVINLWQWDADYTETIKNLGVKLWVAAQIRPTVQLCFSHKAVQNLY